MTTARARLATAGGVFALLLAGFTAQAPGAGATGNQDPGPPGNNGTVKLDGLDLSDGPGHTSKPNDPGETEPDNDPHLTCGFQLEFFNFDAGQLADITFTAHAPTGNGGTLLAQQQVPISDDGTGGANDDPDETFDYDVLADFDTSQFTSVHDTHGWHVKLDLTVYDAEGDQVPGGQKHKVFWVEGCQPTTPPPAPTECPPGMVAPEGQALVDGDDADVLADNCVAPRQELECPPGMVAPEGEALVDGDDADVLADNCVRSTTVVTPPGGDTTDVAPADVPSPAGPVTVPAPAQPGEEKPVVLPAVLEAVQPVAATPPTPEVRGAVVTRSALPRTGADGTMVLTVAGLGLVLVGAGLRRSARHHALVR